jgi:hypothetical protein
MEKKLSTSKEIVQTPNGLVDFWGKGKYSDPEFMWNKTIAPTALKFLNSDKLGKQYQNDMFVGDFDNGYLYHFKLNQNRTGLSLSGPLADKVANNREESELAVFGKRFGGITDIEVGPDDGYLYILSVYQGGGNCQSKYPLKYCINYSSSLKGAIFRIGS